MGRQQPRQRSLVLEVAGIDPHREAVEFLRQNGFSVHQVNAREISCRPAGCRQLHRPPEALECLLMPAELHQGECHVVVRLGVRGSETNRLLKLNKCLRKLALQFQTAGVVMPRFPARGILLERGSEEQVAVAPFRKLGQCRDRPDRNQNYGEGERNPER